MLSGRPGRPDSGRASEVWRRGRDLNPRQSFWPCDGLANRCLRPLGHLSPELVELALRSTGPDIQYHFPPNSRFLQPVSDSCTLLSCRPDRCQGKSRAIGWENERGPFQLILERTSPLRTRRRLWKAYCCVAAVRCVILNTTRRFFSRLSGVSFEAIGCASPYPWADTMFCGRP